MLRDDVPSCPVCVEQALDTVQDVGWHSKDPRYSCGTCNGVLVSEWDVRDLIARATVHKGDEAAKEIVLAPATTPEPIRQCPRCVTKMTKHTLHGIILDRCDEHGYWFDGEELSRVLEKHSAETLKEARKLSPLKQIAVGLGIAGWIAINLLPVFLV